MSTTPDTNAAYLKRFLAGDRTPDVVNEVQRMADNDRLIASVIAELQESPTVGVAHEWKTSAQWADLQRRIAESEKLQTVAPSNRSQLLVERAGPAPRRELVLRPSNQAPRWYRRGVFGAATVALAASIIAAVVVNNRQTLTARPSYEVLTTARGEQRRVSLPDGSTIVVGPLSNLRYSTGVGARNVELDGVAQFTVKHDASRPFVLRAGNTKITDLGTEFVVRSYRDDPKTEVAVSNGRVSLSAMSGGADVVELTAGDAATVTSTGVITKIQNEDVARYSAWSTGQLVFNNQSLGDVSRELTHWFDVSVTIADSGLARKRVSAVYSNASLTGILNALSASMNLQYTREGSRVTLTPAVK